MAVTTGITLREIMSRLAEIVDLESEYLRDSHSLTCEGHVLHGVSTWMDDSYVYAGLSDGIIRFALDGFGRVENWVPLPVSRDQARKIILSANATGS